MKKKLRKELNKLLPEGFKVDKSKLHSITKINDSKFEFGFETLQQSTKEQLLEKAKRDYPEGTIVIDAFDKEKETSTGKSHWYDKRIWDNDENCCLYDKGKWAKIIKKPIFKLQDKYMYEGDDYWNIAKDNYKLSKEVIDTENRYNTNEETGTYIWHENKGWIAEPIKEPKRFLTKQDALNYVLEEAKERFKGHEYFRYIGESKRLTLNNFNYRGLIISENNSITNGTWQLWHENKGWIAEPIKEPKLMLGNYEVEIIKIYDGCLDEFKGIVIKCNGGQVTKEEWMEWYKFVIMFYENKKINFSELLLGKYSTHYTYEFNKISIEPNCKDGIKDITIDQIQAITDRLNEV